jgi:hypothetical protein
MSDRVARERFASLFANTGNGSTSFATARKKIINGDFRRKAISPELRAVDPDTPGYTLLDDPQGELPSLRWPNNGHLALPFDAENRRAFTEWFFASLNSERRLPVPNYVSMVPIVVAPPPADPPTPPLYEKKKAAKSSVERKRKPKRIFLESDDEDTTSTTASSASTATASSAPPKKKEKKEKKRRDSKYDYEDEDGNLEDFVVSDGEIEFED